VGGRKKFWLGISGEALLRCSRLSMDFHTIEEEIP
jgi:hypothetical protein